MKAEDYVLPASVFGVVGSVWVPADDVSGIFASMWFSCFVSSDHAKALLNQCSKDSLLVFADRRRVKVPVVATTVEIVNNIGTIAQVDIELMRTGKPVLARKKN